MIVGLGIDLLENSRVEEELARGDWLLQDGVFTPQEIRQCSGGRRPARRYAACFTTKEATLKAFGVGASDLARFREVEVEVGSRSEYELRLHGRLKTECERLRIKQIWVCVAGNAEHTSAMVVLEA